MAIIIRTTNPEKLKASIINYMRDERVASWIIDADDDITINRDRWRNKAWLRMKDEGDNTLAVGIIASKRYELTTEIYGFFHGSFLTTILTHFDVDMKSIAVTPMLDIRYDKFPLI